MITATTLSVALAVVKGVIRITHEVDQMAAERSLGESPLALGIPEVANPSVDDLIRKVFRPLYEKDNATGGEILSEEQRAALQRIFADNERMVFPPDLEGNALELYYGDLEAIAVEAGIDLPLNRTFIDAINQINPSWLDDPSAIQAVYFLRTSNPGGAEEKSRVWRVTRILLDLFADFGASQVGVFVNDPKLQPVLGAVLKQFGDANIGEGDFIPSDVLRLAFHSTVNGVLDARNSIGRDSEWVTAMLNAFGELRERLDEEDSSLSFDDFVFKLFEGQGYPLLVATLMDATSNVMVLDASQADAMKKIAAGYLEKVADLLEGEPDARVEDFLRRHWGDLFRGALASLNEHSAELIGSGDSPWIDKVLGGLLDTLIETDGLNLGEIFTGDLLVTLGESVIGTVARHPDLLRESINEKWFQEAIASAVKVIADRGLRDTLSPDGLGGLAKEIVTKTADVFIKNPEFFENVIGEPWIRKLAPILAKSLVEHGVVDSWGEDSLKDLIAVVADAAIETFASDPSLIEDGIREEWFASMVSGAVNLAASEGIASVMNLNGAKRLVHAAMKDGAQAVLENPDLLKIDERWFAAVVSAAVDAVTNSEASAFLSRQGVEDLAVAFVDAMVAAAAADPELVESLIDQPRIGAGLQAILEAATDDSIRNQFSKEGLRKVLGTATLSLSKNPALLLAPETPNAMQSLVGGVLSAVGNGSLNKVSAGELAASAVASALSDIAEHPHLMSGHYPEVVSSVAGAVSKIIADGELNREAGLRLLASVPRHLIENAALLTAENRSVAALLIGVTITVSGSVESGVQPDGIDLKVLLVETLDAVLSAVAAKAIVRFEALEEDAIAELIKSDLAEILESGMTILVPEVGRRFGAERFLLLLGQLVSDWMSENLPSLTQSDDFRVHVENLMAA